MPILSLPLSFAIPVAVPLTVAVSLPAALPVVVLMTVPAAGLVAPALFSGAAVVALSGPLPSEERKLRGVYAPPSQHFVRSCWDYSSKVTQLWIILLKAKGVDEKQLKWYLEAEP